MARTLASVRNSPVNPNYAITVREGTMTYYDVKVDDDVISTDFRVVVNDVYYDGTYQEPTVKVYDRYNNRLTEGEDYTLSFSNNRQVGTATVFVTGINSYRGSYATEHFEILSNHSKPTNDRYTIDASASDGGRILRLARIPCGMVRIRLSTSMRTVAMRLSASMSITSMSEPRAATPSAMSARTTRFTLSSQSVIPLTPDMTSPFAPAMAVR